MQGIAYFHSARSQADTYSATASASTQPILTGPWICHSCSRSFPDSASVLLGAAAWRERCAEACTGLRQDRQQDGAVQGSGSDATIDDLERLSDLEDAIADMVQVGPCTTSL